VAVEPAGSTGGPQPRSVRYLTWTGSRGQVVELLLALVLVTASAVHLARFVRLATRHSLWNDEIFSIVVSSSQGPWTVVTEFQTNNHVFFNLINSITPGVGSMDPTRARWWSIVAVVSMLAVGVGSLWRRGWFLAGAVLFTLFAANPEWLDLALQARGYGLVGMFTLLSCLFVWHHLETASVRSLVGLGVATVLGTWTLSSFLLFAAPLWLVLAAVVRTRRVLVGGAVSAAAIGLVYLPIAGQVWTESSTFADRWGRSYTGAGSVAETFSTYLFDSGFWLFDHPSTVVVLAAVASLVPVALIAPVSAGARKLVMVSYATLAAFFAVNLVMGTAVMRTTSFAVVPVAFSGAVLMGELGVLARTRLDRTGRYMTAVVAASAVALMTWQVVQAPRAWFYRPVEDWASASRYVERTFPDGTGLAATYDWLGIVRGSHLDAGFPMDGDQKSSLGLTSGLSVLFDSAPSGRPSFDFSTVAPVWSEARFPQRRGEYLRVLAAPPLSSGVASVDVEGEQLDLDRLTDRDVTGVELPDRGAVRVVIEGSSPVRAVTMVGDGDLPAVEKVVLVGPAGRRTVGPGGFTRSGSTLVVHADDRALSQVVVLFAGADRRPVLSEVWASPPSLVG